MRSSPGRACPVHGLRLAFEAVRGSADTGFRAIQLQHNTRLEPDRVWFNLSRVSQIGMGTFPDPYERSTSLRTRAEVALRRRPIMKTALHTLVALLGAVALLPAAARGQTNAPSATFTDQQLDQMLAPVALYPDSLLAQIFMACTYPDDVVEA